MRHLITIKYALNKGITHPYIKNRLTIILTKTEVANIDCFRRKILIYSVKIEDFIKN